MNWALEYRRKHGLTQRQLAAKLGVSHTHIAQIESGKRQIGLRNLKKFERLLGISATLMRADLLPLIKTQSDRWWLSGLHRPPPLLTRLREKARRK